MGLIISSTSVQNTWYIGITTLSVITTYPLSAPQTKIKLNRQIGNIRVDLRARTSMGVVIQLTVMFAFTLKGPKIHWRYTPLQHPLNEI